MAERPKTEACMDDTFGGGGRGEKRDKSQRKREADAVAEAGSEARRAYFMLETATAKVPREQRGRRKVWERGRKGRRRDG